MIYNDDYFKSGEGANLFVPELPNTYSYRRISDRFNPDAKKFGDVIRTGNANFDRELFEAMETNDLNVVANFLRSSDKNLANQVQGDVLSEMQSRVDRRPSQSALTSKYQPFRDKVRDELSKEYYDFEYATDRPPTEVIKTGDVGFDAGLKRVMDTNDLNLVIDYLNKSKFKGDYGVRGDVIEEMNARIPGVREMPPQAEAAAFTPSSGIEWIQRAALNDTNGQSVINQDEKPVGSLGYGLGVMIGENLLSGN